MIEFKGVHYPKSVILYAVFFYVRYAVSYRDLEEILGERGVTVDHAPLNRWVVKFAPLIAARAASGALPSSRIQWTSACCSAVGGGSIRSMRWESPG